MKVYVVKEEVYIYIWYSGSKFSYIYLLVMIHHKYDLHISTVEPV